MSVKPAEMHYLPATPSLKKGPCYGFITFRFFKTLARLQEGIWNKSNQVLYSITYILPVIRYIFFVIIIIIIISRQDYQEIYLTLYSVCPNSCGTRRTPSPWCILCVVYL